MYRDQLIMMQACSQVKIIHHRNTQHHPQIQSSTSSQSYQHEHQQLIKQNRKQPLSSSTKLVPVPVSISVSGLTSASELLEQSFILFPYYFQHNQRQRWIKLQTQQSQALNAQSNTNKNINDCRLIVVRMVNSFRNVVQPANVIKTWLVDKVTFNVIRTVDGDLPNSQIKYINEKCKRQTIAQNKAAGPYLFIGQGGSTNNWISIQNDAVSGKHLVLTAVPNPHKASQRSIITFILCVRLLRRTNTKSKLQRYISELHDWQIKNIIKYVGSINGDDRYYIMDNRSKNGSYLCQSGAICLGSEGTVYRISKSEGLYLRTVGIVSASKLHSIQTQIDHRLSSQTTSLLEKQTKHPEIHNRNHTLQTTSGIKNVLILAAQTASCCKLNVLYPNQEYALIRHKYQIRIECLPPQTQTQIQTRRESNNSIELTQSQEQQEYRQQHKHQHQQQNDNYNKRKQVQIGNNYAQLQHIRGRIFFDGENWMLQAKSMEDLARKMSSNQKYQVKDVSYVMLGSKVRLMIETNHQF